MMSALFFAEATVPSGSAKQGPSLAGALDLLQGSDHLGVLTANLDRVIDANDAFLRMIRYTREELEDGAIDWRAMTPPESAARDEIALQQLRQFGASVPFEKEYILRDGSRLPMLMGGIRISPDPLSWMCWVLDLSDRKRAEEAERHLRQLESRRDVVNQLAHELNNPLEALILVVYALQARDELRHDATLMGMLHDAEGMLARLSALTRAVLAAGTDPETSSLRD
jgi:PAS domain S-box-containing protein